MNKMSAAESDTRPMPPSDGGRRGDHPPNHKGRLAGIWRLSWQGGIATSLN
jgi:hypothetical protein